jgi:transposase
MGKKRHILVDTLGLLLSAAVHPASIQDRDGAVPLLRAARRLFSFVEVIFADGAYQGQATAEAVARTGRWRLEIVKRSDRTGFVPLPIGPKARSPGGTRSGLTPQPRSEKAQSNRLSGVEAK